MAAGKRILLAVLILRLLADGLGFVVSLSREDEFPVGMLIGTLLFLVLWALAFTGARAARYVMGVLALLSCVIAGFMLTNPAFSRLPLIVAIAINLFTFWACFASAGVKFLEESRNRKT